MIREIIVGRLATDVEYRDGKAYFGVVQSIKGEDKVRPIVSTGKQAESISQYLCKGDLCCVEGHLTAKGTDVSVVADRVTFINSHKG